MEQPWRRPRGRAADTFRDNPCQRARERDASRRPRDELKITGDRQRPAAGDPAGASALPELPVHDVIDLLRPFMRLAWTSPGDGVRSRGPGHLCAPAGYVPRR